MNHNKYKKQVSRHEFLLSVPSKRFNDILTNPPFEKKSSISVENKKGNKEFAIQSPRLPGNQVQQTAQLHAVYPYFAQSGRNNIIFSKKQLRVSRATTSEVWIYDLRTNMRFTLKQSYLDDFVSCYNPEDIAKRSETASQENPDGRWRKCTYDEIIVHYS
ncbi:hypothetical protein QET93_003550 [Akkermansia sp. N21116]|jgi:hypothetical protein|uniref:hypothetical protein n=1 Tax=Akkermansia sp. N21116 TaxID=3040764 RepID=UPI00244EF07E|nr:hypothetical protein [Akkermansia sp. N21116]WPX41178.1 hypothetical protein QET93_003550 [Akkermansia sp. N21116]